jgi:hypothetical protein
MLLTCAAACAVPLRAQVHMPALLAAADRPPGELLSELAGLAAAHEVGLDLGREGALVWRLERQPADWQALVRDMAARLEQVRPAWGAGVGVRQAAAAEVEGDCCGSRPPAGSAMPALFVRSNCVATAGNEAALRIGVLCVMNPAGWWRQVTCMAMKCS